MRSLFSFLIIASLTIWTGCSDKTSGTSEDKQQAPSKMLPKPQNRFRVVDIDQRATTIYFMDGRLEIAKVMQPIVLIHLFASWSAPSCGMIPYLDTLQKSYPKTLFIMGIMANSNNDEKHLRTFMQTNHASYFISNSPDNDALAIQLAAFLKLGENYPIPLTLLFKNGVYTRHYIGATPIEMIKADIEQLRRK